MFWQVGKGSCHVQPSILTVFLWSASWSICWKLRNLTGALTNSLEQSASWEDDSHSASQEIPRLLCNPKVHYRFHKDLPLIPTLIKKHPVRPYHPISLWFILILSFHQHLSLPSGFFPSDFPTKMYEFIISPMHVTCPTNLHLLDFDHPNNIWWSIQITKLFITQSSPASRIFFPVKSKCSPQLPVLIHPQSVFFL